jgi:sugar lactone lactonase YvrE
VVIFLIFDPIPVAAAAFAFQDEEGRRHVVVAVRNDGSTLAKRENLVAEDKFFRHALGFRKFGPHAARAVVPEFRISLDLVEIDEFQHFGQVDLVFEEIFSAGVPVEFRQLLALERLTEIVDLIQPIDCGRLKIRRQKIASTEMIDRGKRQQSFERTLGEFAAAGGEVEVGHARTLAIEISIVEDFRIDGSVHRRKITGMTLETIAKGPFSLGEGIIWDHRIESGRLLWIDIEGQQLLRRDGESDVRAYPLSGMVGTAVLTGDPNVVLLALDNGLTTVNLDSGAETRVAEYPEGPETRFNDGKCDPAGRLWVGTIHREGKSEAANLYCVEPDFLVRNVRERVTIANGICWSGDGRTMFFIDTPTMVVTAFDFDVAAGEISNERVVVRVPEGFGYPDGMTIDTEDKIWVAHWNGSQVVRYDPDDGSVLERVAIPTTKVTSCWFGGENLETLFVTTALGSQDGGWTDREEFPLSGAVFACKPGARGRQSAIFGQGSP